MKRLPVIYALWILLAVSVAAFADTPMDLVAAGSGIQPINNTFTLLPGTGSKYYTTGDVTNHDFGGAGSLSLASETARADTDGLNMEPKGLFRSVLRFDSSLLPEEELDSLTLNLYITNGNTSAGGLFNYRGTAGYFTVSLIYDGWNQGSGTPLSGAATIADTGITDAYETDPLTHNNLNAMLANEMNVELATVYYDASVPYPTASWFSFDLTTALEIPEFAAILDAGGTFSLLLSPTDADKDGNSDGSVAFNFKAGVQNTSGTLSYIPEGPVLSFTTVPEPASLVLLTVGLALGLRTKRKRK